MSSSQLTRSRRFHRQGSLPLASYGLAKILAQILFRVCFRYNAHSVADKGHSELLVGVGKLLTLTVSGRGPTAEGSRFPHPYDLTRALARPFPRFYTPSILHPRFLHRTYQALQAP